MEERSSEYRSVRTLHVPRMMSVSSVSSAPSRMGVRRSVPLTPKRHVKSVPSGERRSRVQSPQKGCVTDAMTPISPPPSLYL